MTAGLTGAVGLSATACGGDDSGSSSETVLKLVAAEAGEASDTGSTQRYWNELVADFRLEHPEIIIDVTTLRWQDANAEVARMVAEGDAPDIAQIGAFADFASAGKLYKAEELLPISQLADFIPSLAIAGEMRRVQYGMPFAARIGRLFYNKDLFEDAGLDPDVPPETWEELLEAATALRTTGVEVPFALPLGHDDAAGEALMWMLAGGGGLTDNTGGYTLNSPMNASTFNWLRDELVTPGLTGDRPPGSTTRQQAYSGFAEGTVGMLFADPVLMRQSDRGGVSYGTAELPGSAAPSTSTLGEASWLMAFNQRGHREEIGTFLKYVFTAENVNTFAERWELLPVTTPASQAMQDQEEGQEGERLTPFLDALPTATFFPVGKVSWSRVSTLVAQGIGATLEPNSNVPAILADLQEQAETADLGEQPTS
ncbi:ABC transporter substrate-binding protein [Streptomyces xiamenensis]